MGVFLLSHLLLYGAALGKCTLPLPKAHFSVSAAFLGEQKCHSGPPQALQLI